MSGLFTRKQIEERDSRENAAIIIDNVVYDVSTFLNDHPGGVEVLLTNAGQDASRCFHDVGHSDDAKLWREQFKIGEVVDADKWEVISKDDGLSQAGTELTFRGIVDVLAPPMLLATLAIWAYYYLF